MAVNLLNRMTQRPARRRLAAVAILGAVLVAVAPSGVMAGSRIVLERRDGGAIRGELQRAEEDRFVVLVDGQEQEVRFEVLTPRSIFAGRAALLSPDDAQGHFDLGVYGQEQGLFDEASRAFLQARHGAAALAEQAEALRRRARASEAHRRFRRALQLEQGRQLDEALTEFLRVYVQFPDVEDEQLQASLLDHIRTLQHDLGLDQRLPARERVEGMQGDEPAAPDNGGAERPDAPAGDATAFDSTEGMDRRETVAYDRAVRLYTTILNELQDGEQKLRLAHSRQASDDIGSPYILSTLNDAFEQWRRANGRIGEMQGMLRDSWPRLALLVERLGPRLQQLYVNLGEAYISVAIRRGNNAEAYRWINLVLAREPSNEYARRIRLLLTEQALRERFR